MATPDTQTFTGRSRRRTTRRSVRVVDKVARALITVGGIGTILAISTVGVFLVWVVVPLFLPAKLDRGREIPRAGPPARPLHVAVDETQTLGYALGDDGTLSVFSLADGKQLRSEPLVVSGALTAAAFTARGDDAVFGFADGSVRLGHIRFTMGFPPADSLPPAVRALAAGATAPLGAGLAVRAQQGQLRVHGVEAQLDAPLAEPGGSPVRLLDASWRSSGPVVCALSADGTLRLHSLRQRKNLLTGQVTWTARSSTTPLPPHADGRAPSFLLLSAQGDQVFVAWEDGQLLRLRSDGATLRPVEQADLVAAPGDRLTALAFLLGRTTLVAGDSRGSVCAWFVAPSPHAGGADGQGLVLAHDLGLGQGAVTALASSSRTRLVAAGHAGGELRLLHVTSGRQLASVRRPQLGAIAAVALAPKDDGLLAWGAAAAGLWRVDPRHPEAGLAGLFRPVWYEGYPEPLHVWQSSGGSDDAEPKLGVMPLVFGTLKATLYSMLLGVPIALLAAVFTSEFLSPRARARVKPAIELMASLPSVVLGFLAALVIAPFVRTVLPSVLAALATVPLAFLAGAYLWQLLPQGTSLRLLRGRFACICAMLPVGIAGAALLGPPVERAFFAGDIMRWLDGQVGGAAGGWTLLTLPISALAAALLGDRTIGPWLRRMGPRWSRQRWAAADALRFALGVLLTLAMALGISGALAALGLDPRGAYLGTYVQSNSLIVGFVMGFAIIPIIYTIAEDALAAVPEHLRSASLGAGATPWQTAHRIVIPTAMSGIFSAVMVGLGRAVGETMIVLMAAGNTPIMDWNVFNGFRTLSANIAVEMPEAVRGSTHFRTLFLAALTLFAMTFLLNTAAEIVRQRYRKRAFEL